MDNSGIILSEARTGSTAFYYKMLELNKKAGYQSVNSLPWCSGTELFYIKNSKLSIKQRIKFLENERKKGIEWCFKVHYHQLLDYDIKDWFYNFYKSHNIIRITRRDKWTWFLSMYFQECNNWQITNVSKWEIEKLNWFEWEKRVPKMIRQQKYGKNYQKSIDNFIRKINNFENAKCDKTIYYEDIDFSDSTILKLTDTIRYEDYFFNIDQIKRAFDEAIANRYNH